MFLQVSSGMCGSTCAVFSEALAEQGVQSIAFGGRPRKGPMQTVGGIKGSQVLKFDEISNWAYRFLGEEPDIVCSKIFIPQKPSISYANLCSTILTTYLVC